MAGRIAYYGGIVTNGLVLDLDAAKRDSYPGSGTTWNDISGNVNNGTLTNGPTFNTGSGGSIVFDGVDDYVDCGSGSSLNISNEITLHAWINGTYSSNGEYAVIDKGGVTGHHFGIYLKKIILQTNIAYKLSNTTLNNGIWYNIVITFDKTNVYFYLNGVIDGVQPLTGGLNAPSSPVLIARYTSASPLTFNGLISNTFIYNRSLSASEILQNYNALKSRYGL
jgi:hypothetical protein